MSPTAHQTPTDQRCPRCGATLTSEGTHLRCAEHGDFFRYGPRLLVAIARTQDETSPLLPWQTMAERAVG
jgi:hypothetical protein